MNIFKSNKTKWIPLGSYHWGGNAEYIVFVRGDKNTGLLDFKTKRTNSIGISDCVRPVLPHDIIDTRKQWELILNLINV
jgi:hypothetical protein